MKYCFNNYFKILIYLYTDETLLSETIEAKIQKLHKYVTEISAQYHILELITEIQNELEQGGTIDVDHEKLLLDAMDILAKRGSNLLYCKCGHEIQDHVNFQQEITSGCKGKNQDNRPCDCKIFTLQ